MTDHTTRDELVRKLGEAEAAAKALDDIAQPLFHSIIDMTQHINRIKAMSRQHEREAATLRDALALLDRATGHERA